MSGGKSCKKTRDKEKGRKERLVSQVNIHLNTKKLRTNHDFSATPDNLIIYQNGKTGGGVERSQYTAQKVKFTKKQDQEQTNEFSNYYFVF